jgi:Uma2 family endonuclease
MGMTQTLERPSSHLEPMRSKLEPKLEIQHGHSRVLPINVVQYEALGEMGLLPTRVELIKGAITGMTPMGDSHIISLDSFDDRLRHQFRSRARVTSQTPVRLTEAFGEPEPDFMLCKLGSRGVTNPEDVLLVIEIAKTTLETDRADKLPMYAQHSIPEVWIHNLNNNTLEVYRNPRLVSSGWAYDAPVILEVGQLVAPLAFPEDVLEWW